MSLRVLHDEPEQIATVLKCDAARDAISGERADWAWRRLGDLLHDRNEMATEIERLRVAALAVCETIDACQLYGPADKLRDRASRLRALAALSPEAEQSE